MLVYIYRKVAEANMLFVDAFKGVLKILFF